MFLTSLVMVTLTYCEHAIAQMPRVRITSLNSGTQASFRGIAVRGAREAWITGSNGTVIRTIDAGRTWRQVVVPGSNELDFRDVEILPGETVVVMSAGSGDASRILRSTDAGDSWKTVLINRNPDGFFDGMAFDVEGKRGVLFGDPLNRRLDLYETADGGATWQRFPNEHRPRVNEGEYGFAASGTGIVMRETNLWIATGGSVARVHHSSDLGANWAVYNTPVRSGNESSGIFSIDFVDEQTAIVIGGDYKQPELERNNVARSIDGGKSWSSLPNARMPHKACVQAIGNGGLVTCGRTGVAFSSDHGQTWQTVSTDSYFTLAIDPASLSGFLAGFDGRIARLEYGGNEP